MGTVEDEERRAMRGEEPPPGGEPPASSSRRAPGGRPAPEEEYLTEEYEEEMERLAARRHDEVMGALRKLFGKLLDIERRVIAVERRAASTPAPHSGGAAPGDDRLDLEAVASDRDLDGAKGDPVIKYDPKEKYWSGQSYAGYKFSETTPDYLDAMAKSLAAAAYMAAKDPDEKKRKGARWKALDASRARGWAKRLRNGWGGAQAEASRSGSEAGDEGPEASPPSPPGDDIMI